MGPVPAQHGRSVRHPEMPPDPKTVAQVLILTVGIHLFLFFLTTARSSRMIRGAAVAYFLLYVILLSIAQSADLVELEVTPNPKPNPELNPNPNPNPELNPNPNPNPNPDPKP